MYEEQLSKALSVEGLSQQDIEGALETPKEPKLGDICLPCFKFARAMRLAPPVIAAKLLPYAQEQEFVDRAEVAGGYLNIFFNRAVIADKIKEVALSGNRAGSGKEGEGKTICIDYSSVNIAKPFHIGHLSTTVIGGALYRIFEHLGYKVVGINHLGDWGTQFGKLIVATRKWSSLGEVEKNDEYFLNSLLFLHIFRKYLPDHTL